MASGNVSVMNTSGMDRLKSLSKKQTGGSVKSMKSLGGVSIFQDPEAGTTLPRDVEMTLTMYDKPVDEKRKSTSEYSMNITSSKRSSGSSQLSSLTQPSTLQNGDVIVNGDRNSKGNVKDNGGYTFTYSSTMVSENSGSSTLPSGSTRKQQQQQSSSSSTSAHQVTSTLPNQKKKSVAKTGSFTMKSAYGNVSGSQNTANSSQGGVKKSQLTSDGSFITKSSSIGKDSKLGINQFNSSGMKATSTGNNTSSKQGSYVTSTTTTTVNQVQTNNEIPKTVVDIPDSKSERRDSDLTSVSSLTSYAVSESYQKRGNNRQLDISDKKWASGSNVGDFSQSVSRSNSQVSDSKSMSQAPSLSSMHEYNKMIITDVYKEGDSNKGSADKREGGYSAQSGYAIKTNKLEPKGSSNTTQVTEVTKVSHTKVSNNDSVIKGRGDQKAKIGSDSPSIMQNKEFRDKMSSLFNSSGPKQPELISNSVVSSASSTMARGSEKSYRNDVHVEIKSETEKNGDFYYNSTYTSPPPGDNRPISPIPVSPVKEMKETIKFGTVGSLVKDKFKNLNLTGRSVDPSTIERQKSKTTIESTSADTTSGEQKKFKFLIEGIDYPETDVTVVSPEARGGEGNMSPEATDSSEDGTLTKKRELQKRGFSYVLDEKLASAIIKKAEDVQARKPHEALEEKTKDTQNVELQESEVLVEAKAKLKHDESLKRQRPDFKTRSPMESALLKDIRSRLVRPESTVVVEEESTTRADTEKYDETLILEEESVRVIKTSDKNNTQLDTSTNTQQESIVSSVTTIESQSTDVTSQDEIPMSDNKLIYDGYKYEIMNKNISPNDKPKSYSQVFNAEAVSPKGNSKTYLNERENYNSEYPGLRSNNFETIVNYSERKSPEEVTVHYSPKLISKNEAQISKQQHQPTNRKSEAIRNEETVINTEVKSLRDMNRYNNYNNITREPLLISNTVTTRVTEHDMKSDSSSSSSASSVVEVVTRHNPNLVNVPSNRSSISSESTISQQYDIDQDTLTYDKTEVVVVEDEIVPLKKQSDKIPYTDNINITNITVTNNTPRNSDLYTETEHVMDSFNKSDGTNTKTVLNVSPPRHVSQHYLVDEDTIESYKNGVTSVKPIKGSGKHSSELYIEVGGGKHSVYDQQGVYNTNNTGNRKQVEGTFYQAGHLLQQSDDVTVHRIKSPKGQLYTSVHSPNNQLSPNEIGYEEQRSPKGGLLLLRQSPHTSGLSSPRYPASESTHNSTSSGPVSSPVSRDEIFYQPPRLQVDPWNNVSRSSSSVTGSVYSQRSDGVYVYRTQNKPGRTLSDLGQGVVHLKPLKASRGIKELQTHPTFYSPSVSSISVPVNTMNDFDTTNMNGTSTLRPNTDTGYIHVINNNSTGSVKIQRDENMNYTSPPMSPQNRMLTVDEVSRGRIPIRKGLQVSTINIDTEPYDGFSGISDPTFSRNSKYRVQKVMDQRRVNNEFVTPIDMHPDTAYKKQKFYSVQRNTKAVPVNPEVQVELDPHLQEAHKKGNNYNVTMKLNASVLGMKPGSRSEDMFREEYVEESLYKNNNSMRGAPPQLPSPRGQSSMSVSDDSVILSPGSRSRTNITLIDEYQTSPPPTTTSTNVDHLRFKQFVGQPPQINVTSKNVMNEPYLRPSNNNVPQRSPANSNIGGTAPKFSMNIDQTMTMDYVPTDQENDNNRQRANEPLLQRQNAPNQQQPHRPAKQRHNKPEMEYNRMVMNGDVYHSNSNTYQEDDDLEQYFSPAEEDIIAPQRVPKNDTGQGYGYPQVVRGSILIKNAIDTTGAPKVVDVVEGDTESDDDTLIYDNVNPFHGGYFQARENPMYSSDPDIRAALLREREKELKSAPQFTKMFDQKTSKTRHGGGNSRMRSFENDDYDTEIQVTRVSSNSAASAGPKKQKISNSSANTYVYNGYDHPDRGASSSSASRSASQYASQSASKSGSGGRSNLSKGESRSEFEIQRLLKNAPPGSIKQTINVEREEEEILGPLPNGDDGTGPDSLLNFDTVSEKVDLGMKDGAAQVAVKVRCERIVPIRGVEDMFKKSSVIVTRLIEIDLMVTDERKQLYEHITNKSRNMITSGRDGKSRSSNESYEQKLSNRDTFKLYKTFMGMAEADEQGKNIDNLRIDRKVEEQNRPEVQAKANLLDMDMEDGDDFEYDTDALDRQLEEQLIAQAMRHPEPDTISYMSAASESSNILY